MSELCFDSAVNLVRRLRNREVSAVEVMEAHLAQVRRLNPSLNAIVSLDEELALSRARKADDMFAELSKAPLFGLPIAHKDLVLTRGLRTTFGSPLFAEHIPDEDDAIVERIRQRGGLDHRS